MIVTLGTALSGLSFEIQAFSVFRPLECIVQQYANFILKYEIQIFRLLECIIQQYAKFILKYNGTEAH